MTIEVDFVVRMEVENFEITYHFCRALYSTSHIKQIKATPTTMSVPVIQKVLHG